jgi:hypothetical protein
MPVVEVARVGTGRRGVHESLARRWYSARHSPRVMARSQMLQIVATAWSLAFEYSAMWLFKQLHGQVALRDWGRCSTLFLLPLLVLVRAAPPKGGAVTR